MGRMADRATPNLPSRDFAATSEFYARLGFTEGLRDEGWMILTRGEIMLEFFPYADLDPATSSFSCTLRLDDLEAFHTQCLEAGVPESTEGWPRVHAPQPLVPGLRVGALIDPDCTLLRLIGE